MIKKMAKAIYEGIGGVARKVKAVHEGIGGVARKVKAGYIGVGGVARQFFTSDDKAYLYNNGTVSPYTWSASASPASMQTNYMSVSGSSTYYSNPARFNMTAGNTNITSLDNYSKLMINAKSGSSSYTSHYVGLWFTFSNGEYVYIGGNYTFSTDGSLVTIGRITKDNKTKYKNLYASYGAPTIKIEVYQYSRSSSPKYQCRALDIYQVYFESMSSISSGIITKTVRQDNKCTVTQQQNYLEIHCNVSSDSSNTYTYAYVYGSFSNISYSFTVSSSDAADGGVVWVEIYYKKTSDATSYTSKTLTFGSGTQTGTFPANTEYFRFKTGPNKEAQGDVQVYSVILGGVDYTDYLYYASWPY